MFYQTDEELQFKADSDCYNFVILKIHELEGKHEFTREQVMQLRAVSVRADFIDDEGYLNDKGIQGVAMSASGITKKHVYIRRVTNNSNYNYIIARYGRRTNSGKLVNHFVLADNVRPADLIAWDPWSAEGSKTGRVGYIMGYRYIFAEAV